MADDTPQTAETPAAAPPPAAATHRKRNTALTILLAVLLIPAVIIALWIWVALGFTYSTGERAGYLQKISKKGWICKTWEGEIAMTPLPGATPQYFQFTVRNDSIANVLEQNAGKQVSLTYEEHRGIPSSCFGDTRYFVTSVRRLNP
ncbi:MAG TPA: hypothetical protein VFP26_03680 [Gemmatimonadaceae bacterium]|jgi:hypothetical protein|nr:hypothetical protein [Gemmatimonadaceae bacterium]